MGPRIVRVKLEEGSKLGRYKEPAGQRVACNHDWEGVAQGLLDMGCPSQ